MTFNYVARAKKAAASISKYGTTAILSQAGPMVGPAWAATPGDPIESQVSLVVMSQAQTPSPDGLATRLVKTLLVAAGPLFSPKKGDTLLFGEVQHEILEAKPFAPADVVIYFEVQAAT